MYFKKTKKVFCLVFLDRSEETNSRVKRSSWVILAIFDHFCKIEKAHIGAILFFGTIPQSYLMYVGNHTLV